LSDLDRCLDVVFRLAIRSDVEDEANEGRQGHFSATFAAICISSGTQ
jgi:hypothetical protein